MDIATILKEAGPYTAPLCAAMVLALRWAMKDRDRLIALLAEANADRMALREKRADDLERAAIEYREFGESSREVMREWATKAQGLVDAVRDAISDRASGQG